MYHRSLFFFFFLFSAAQKHFNKALKALAMTTNRVVHHHGNAAENSFDLGSERSNIRLDWKYRVHLDTTWNSHGLSVLLSLLRWETRGILLDAQGIQQDTATKSQSRAEGKFPRARNSKFEPIYVKRQNFKRINKNSKEEIVLDHSWLHVSLNLSLNS